MIGYAWGQATSLGTVLPIRSIMREGGRLVAATLVLAGLAGCSLGLAPPALTQLDAAQIPDVAMLAGRIEDTFRAVKLTGYPRVSAVRQAPVSAFGDWLICLRSDAEEDSRVYALIIANNDVVDYRLALLVDGCEHEQFAPLPTARAYR
jgi:hypothetical protein